MKTIKKYGLLSLYGLYMKDKKLFKNATDVYKSRMENDEPDFIDYENYFTKKGLSTKCIFFSFWEIIPGLSKGRDEFVKKAILIKINVEKLNPNWKYILVEASKTKPINLDIVKELCEKSSDEYQKKQGGRYLFTNIPHLAIQTNDGIIKKELLLI